MGLKNRKEAWKGTCSQPAKQRKPEDKTLKPRQQKQAHKRANLTSKTTSSLYKLPKPQQMLSRKLNQHQSQSDLYHESGTL